MKRLANFTPESRLRVGNYRGLFKVEVAMILVYRVKHRSDAHRTRGSETIIPLHLEFLTRNGRKEFAVLPSEKFLAVQEILEDAADLIEFQAAKAEATETKRIPLVEVKMRLGLD